MSLVALVKTSPGRGYIGNQRPFGKARVFFAWNDKREILAKWRLSVNGENLGTAGKDPERPGKKIFLGMGSNLGDRLHFLSEGLKSLEDSGVELLRISSLYDSDPVGFRDQGTFLNLAVEVDFSGGPRELLERCLRVEKAMGRERGTKNGPRTLDIDILLWGDRILREKELVIPHPRLHERRFVLVPLAEIAPDFPHAVLQATIRELLSRCPDTSGVRDTRHQLSLERPDPSGYNPAASRGKAQ